ncbi:hypothetical protein Hanom_Chr16g01486991 [Helianthus anomalus]
MSKTFLVPVPVPYLPKRVLFWYRFGTDFKHFRYRFGTGIYRFLPSNTGTEPYRTGYIRYRYPLWGFSVPVLSIPNGTELIPIAPPITKPM